MNYYNEFDAKAAAWIRQLIKAGLISDGHVDERSIVDVRPNDLRGYRQCHFFAGIGGWSAAFRLAGIPDDEEGWSASVRCQPFSDAGLRKGIFDPRHLWPYFFPLVAECRPPVVYGEQVASKAALGWLDGVQSDMEGQGYAFGAHDLCSASVGSPTIRQRLFWVAESDGWKSGHRQLQRGREHGLLEKDGGADRMEHAEGDGRGERRPEPSGRGIEPRRADGGLVGRDFWGSFDVLICRDGNARRVEPGTFPLVNGLPGRVGLLRGYGNAINPVVAAEFIKAHRQTIE